MSKAEARRAWIAEAQNRLTGDGNRGSSPSSSVLV